jgi:hypothetical protein
VNDLTSLVLKIREQDGEIARLRSEIADLQDSLVSLKKGRPVAPKHEWLLALAENLSGGSPWKKEQET